METKTAISIDEANVAELEQRFGDKIERSVIEDLYRRNVKDLTRRAGGSFMMFVPDVAQRRTEQQLVPIYSAKASETYAEQ